MERAGRWYHFFTYYWSIYHHTQREIGSIQNGSQKRSFPFAFSKVFQKLSKQKPKSKAHSIHEKADHKGRKRHYPPPPTVRRGRGCVHSLGGVFVCNAFIFGVGHLKWKREGGIDCKDHKSYVFPSLATKFIAEDHEMLSLKCYF